MFGEAIRASGTEAMAGLGKAFKQRQSACELDMTLQENVRHVFWLICRSGPTEEQRRNAQEVW